MNFIDDYSTISIPSIIRYLKLQGWDKRSDFPTDKLIVFDGPQDMYGDRIQAVIPANARYKDYPLRVKELVYSLSEIENRPIKNILADISNPNIDRLNVRVLSDFSKDGTLPFSYAAKLVNGLKDFLVAAACVEENPQPFYRRATRVGFNYADNCRFGQTKVGSFIITIESLVPSYTQLSLPIRDIERETEHFNRRVIKRIQRGIGLVEKSVSEGDITPIVNDFKSGLNANMCEALLGLKIDQYDIDLEYSVNWSMSIPKPNDVPDKVKIEKIGFDYLASAAKVLRDSDESVKRKIVGKVVKLSAFDLEEDDEGDSNNRLVTVKTEIHDKQIKVNVPLNIIEYKLACDAHRDIKDVQVEGMLERVGNQWQLMAPENFRVL
jgi:hypothetical protein